MTDGEENNSHNFKQADVKALTKRLEDKKYEVIFLGANFDKVGDVATGFGLSSSKWTPVSSHNLSDYMTGTVAASSTNYLTRGVGMAFTVEDKIRATSKK
jgi:hypothetical protein